MKKKLLIITSLACALAVAANAQSYKKTDFGIRSSIDSLEVEIQFYGPSTVRVLKSLKGKTFTRNSLSVIGSPQKITLSIKEAGSELFLNSDSVRVGLNLINGRISFSTRGGEPLLLEKEHSVAFTDFNDAGDKTYNVSQSFTLDTGEAIYGLGQQQHGKVV